MPPLKKDAVVVACPKCGHEQAEPRSAYSTVCKACRQHFRLQEALPQSPLPGQTRVERRRVRCFQCGTDLDVPVAAASSMCKRCSSHIDLADYTITQTVSKNFRTYGRLVVEEKGYVLNSDAQVGDAVIKGRFIGKLRAQGTLQIFPSAQIKGTISGGVLLVPAGQHLWWPEPLSVGGAEIAGELAAGISAAGTVFLRSTARLFGEVKASNLVVEPGAVLVGQVRISPGTGAPGG